jgi:hypothetical protein
LKQKKAIEKIVASFLLLLFTISIVPKIYFHNLIADHKDFSTCDEVHKTPVLHVQGYNCHFDDLVVSASYLFQKEEPGLLINIVFEQKQPAFSSACLPSFSQHKENRGPPSA